MSVHALMEKKGEGRMHVPPDKVEQFIAAGWVVVTPADQLPAVKKVDELPTSLNVQVEAESAPQEPYQTKKGKAKEGRNAHPARKGNA